VTPVGISAASALDTGQKDSGTVSQAHIEISAANAFAIDRNGELIHIEGTLVGKNRGLSGSTLFLSSGGIVFPAILPPDVVGNEKQLESSWADGSRVEVTGVLAAKVDEERTIRQEGIARFETFQILLRSPEDVAVISAPSWWTSQHALESFAVVSLVVLAAFAWIIILCYRLKLQMRALRASEDRLRHLSEHDALTGLPNRILLNDRLQTALKRAGRFRTCLGVLLVDVDGFKEVNDALGHQAGDTLLCHLAARFNNCMRATDTAARIGGDEFVVLLPDLRFPVEAANIAAKIVSAVSDPLAIDRTLVVITASIGVVTYPEGSASPEALMQCADEAMYAAKEKGKNGFQVYRPKPAASAGEGGSVLGPAPHFALPTGRAWSPGRDQMRTQRVIALIVTLAATCLAAGAQASSASQGPHRIIETARAVHSLPPEEAAHEYPVRLHAVVSYYDPYIDPRRGALFVQDASGGVFVSLPARPILAIKPGDLVAITGVTGPGDYAAIVTAAQVLPVGQSRLPARPLKTTLMQLLTGAFDCQWVEVEGRVRSAHLGPGNVVLGVAANGGSLTAVTVRQPGVDYEALVDSLVRIDGVAAPVFNQRRQMVGVRVFFPTLRQINVIQPAPRDPFTAPTVSISDLFRNSAVHGLLHRVHVRGTVTLDWPGLMLCIQDGKSGICMQTAQAASVPAGSFVDVVGFPAINLFKPTLEDAVFRTAGGPAAPASPVPITADQAITGDLDGRLVQIDAELIGRNLAATDPTLMLRAGRLIFPVILPRDATLGAVTWKDGSVLRITGVCNTQIDSLNSNLLGGPVRLQSVRVLLRSIDDISLLQAPSWWTSQHALAVLGLSVLTMLTILGYRESKTRRHMGTLAYIEQRRGRILESINSSEPLAEILERITQLVSLRLSGAPCWCQVADGATLGNRPSGLESSSLRALEHPIAGHSGRVLGAIYAAFHARTKPAAEEKRALAMAAELATLAIETSRLHSDLVHRSEFDLLTDAQNRFALEKTLDAMIQAARQSAGILGLIYIDLNEFKQVNDVYGHQAGDFYLQELTRRMKRQLRPGDTLARLGGDEFAVLVSDVHCRAGVEEIAARLECCFRDPFIGENYVLHGSASFGIALYPDDAGSADSLLCAADAAMYVAKNTRLGKTRVPDNA
jgi:diguanylate cyclase (GGDEF)-like protein